MIPREKNSSFYCLEKLCQQKVVFHARNLRVQFIYSIKELNVKFLHLILNSERCINKAVTRLNT